MDFTTIAMIALMVVAFYFLILRPQKKRQQAQQKTMNELVPGTRVLLGSGIFGTLTWVGTKQATLELAPGHEITILKQAIARVITEGDEYAEPEAVEDEDDDELEQLDSEPGGDELASAEPSVVQRDSVADATVTPSGDDTTSPTSTTSTTRD